MLRVCAKDITPCGSSTRTLCNITRHARQPFYEREVALGGYFMEVAGWERAHGYAANEEALLAKYRDQVPTREAEWDNRHFWEVSNAEQLGHERRRWHDQPLTLRHL